MMEKAWKIIETMDSHKLVALWNRYCAHAMIDGCIGDMDEFNVVLGHLQPIEIAVAVLDAPGFSPYDKWFCIDEMGLQSSNEPLDLIDEDGLAEYLVNDPEESRKFGLFKEE